MMSQRAMRMSFVVFAIGALIAVNAAASSPQSVAAAHRSAAVASADQMLTDVVMPAGSLRVSKLPRGASALRPPPPIRLWLQAQVDHHSLWTTNADPSSVFEWIRSHLPASWGLGGSGGSDSDGFEMGSITAPTVEPRILGTRQLAVDAVTLSNGKTAVRIDAEVQYLAPRTSAQRIPADAKLLQITRGPVGSQSPQLVRTVTESATLHRIATDLDALPFGGNWHGAAFSCPGEEVNTPIDTFTFRAAATGPVLARFSESADTPTTVDPCATASLTVRAHALPAIVEGGRLLLEVDRLLKVRLTAR
jgi:hypothetical protein